MILPVAIALFAALMLYAGTHDIPVTDALGIMLGRQPRGRLGSLSGAPTGGNAPAAGGTPTGSFGGLSSPFTHKVTLGRTDMGVDIGAPSLKPGDPIEASASGRVAGIVPNWYSGQPAIFVQFDKPATDASGLPHWGEYVGEQIVPKVHLGQRVNAGDVLATFAQRGTGIEMGWAGSSTKTEQQVQNPGVGDRMTYIGESFRDFLKRVGAA